MVGTVSWGVLSTANIGMQKVIPAMLKGEVARVEAIASRDAAKARRGGGMDGSFLKVLVKDVVVGKLAPGIAQPKGGLE